MVAAIFVAVVVAVAGIVTDAVGGIPPSRPLDFESASKTGEVTAMARNRISNWDIGKYQAGLTARKAPASI